MIGFTLPETSVTAAIIPMESDVTVANIYSSTLWLLYIGSIAIFLIWYHTIDKKEFWIHKWIDHNESLTVGIFTTAVTVGMIEGSTRLANCIIWTYYTLQHNVELNVGNIIFTIWMPQIFVLICGTLVLIGCHCIECCIAICKRETDFYIHIILPIYLIGFGLVYSLFPAIILILAYPIQVIATLTFVLAYLFATTVFSAILYKWYQQCCEKHCRQYYKQRCESSNGIMKCKTTCEQFSNKDKKPQLCKLTLLCFIVLIIPILLILLYLQLIAMVFLYSLLIGRGSAINTGPLFAISLLPSLLISSVAWVAKRVALHETENNSNNNNNLFTSSTENSSVNSSTSQSINLSTSQFENVST